jgi:hypothetical protein
VPGLAPGWLLVWLLFDYFCSENTPGKYKIFTITRRTKKNFVH